MNLVATRERNARNLHKFTNVRALLATTHKESLKALKNADSADRTLQFHTSQTKTTNYAKYTGTTTHHRLPNFTI